MRWFGREAAVPETDPATSGNKGTGNQGEEIAANFLIARGYRILERNFRCKGGVVDIIARDPAVKSLVFIEVKASRSWRQPLSNRLLDPPPGLRPSRGNALASVQGASA